MKIETKTLALEVKAAGDEGRLEGHAAAFNNVDWYGDMILPGAFAKTIREKRGIFPILADHMPSWQIGWNEKASEDAHGLLVAGTLDIGANQKAKEKHSLAKKGMELGARVGLSIGYSAMQYEYQEIDGKRVRLLKEVRLWEYSLVTFPANEEAFVSGVKGVIAGDNFESSLDELVAAFSGKGYSDSQILQALESRAAKRRREPDAKEVHSLVQQIHDLKNLLATA